jgi:hypothetical protein
MDARDVAPPSGDPRDDAAATIPRRYNFAEDILTRNLAAGRAGKAAYIDPRGSASGLRNSASSCVGSALRASSAS